MAVGVSLRVDLVHRTSGDGGITPRHRPGKDCDGLGEFSVQWIVDIEIVELPTRLIIECIICVHIR